MCAAMGRIRDGKERSGKDPEETEDNIEKVIRQ